MNGLFFQARILAREGRNFSAKQRSWIGSASGIRVYMEGFRVLPYGEPADDWLEIDADYVKRKRSLRFLDEFGKEIVDHAGDDEDEARNFQRKDAYFGAVFLTQENSPTLLIVVNREGFVPDAAYDTTSNSDRH